MFKRESSCIKPKNETIKRRKNDLIRDPNKKVQKVQPKTYLFNQEKFAHMESRPNSKIDISLKGQKKKPKIQTHHTDQNRMKS
jgi:hypothetical protein